MCHGIVLPEQIPCQVQLHSTADKAVPVHLHERMLHQMQSALSHSSMNLKKNISLKNLIYGGHKLTDFFMENSNIEIL